jgi:hypothetical protein
MLGRTGPVVRDKLSPSRRAGNGAHDPKRKATLPKKFLVELRRALTIPFNAKPSAKYRHLVGAAEGGKGIDGDAGGVLGPRVVRTGNRLMSRKCGLCDGQSLGRAPRVQKEARIMTCVPLRQWVAAAERLFGDGNRPPE